MVVRKSLLRLEVLARRLVAAGETLDAAAAVVGLSYPTVRSMVVDAGGMPPHQVLDSPSKLCLAEREEIRVGLEAGWSLRRIASALGRAPSTISREVNGSGGRDAYRAVGAQRRADDRAKRPKLLWYETSPLVWSMVQGRLRELWSPAQISATLRTEFPSSPEMWVSVETIYKSIYLQPKGELRRELAACLRSGRARRLPRRPATSARRVSGSSIPDPVNISERPAEAADRAVPGHWEGDLILGKNGSSAVATLVERATRFVVLVQVDSKDAGHVAQRLSQEAVAKIPVALRRSLTWDQGTEMAAHQTFTLETGCPVYFCDPRSPWQRGTNENTNGLLRQYMPKGTDLSQHSQADLDAMADSLNGRPRQTLNWMKPSQALANVLR